MPIPVPAVAFALFVIAMAGDGPTKFTLAKYGILLTIGIAQSLAIAPGDANWFGFKQYNVWPPEEYYGDNTNFGVTYYHV